MKNFKVYKTIHFSDEWAKQITNTHHKENNTTTGTYMYYNVVNMNYDSLHHFYIVGILDDVLIASCFVSSYEDFSGDKVKEDYEEYLISYLMIDKDYQRKGYGTEFLKSVIQILKEENATKIVAFACENSKKLFENFGFIKNENIKAFGSTVPGDDNDVYYELNLESNFYLSKLNNDDIKFVSMSLLNELKKYKRELKDIPDILLPNASMYKSRIMFYDSLDNSCVKTLRCNKMAVGYVYLYYHDFDDSFGNSDHSVHLCFYIDQKYLYKSAVKVMIEETERFFKEQKENHNIECIKVNLDKYSIIMDHYDFYKDALLKYGFKQIDESLFTKAVE